MIYHSTLSTFTIYPLANWQFVPEHQADFSWNLSNPQLLRYSHSDIIVIIVNHIWSYRSYSYVHFLEAIYFHFHQPMAIYIYHTHIYIYIHLCVIYIYIYIIYVYILYIPCHHEKLGLSLSEKALHPLTLRGLRESFGFSEATEVQAQAPSAGEAPRFFRGKRWVFTGENGGFKGFNYGRCWVLHGFLSVITYNQGKWSV